MGKVQCELCKKWFIIINNSHLNRKHGITLEDYINRFGSFSYFIPKNNLTGKKISKLQIFEKIIENDKFKYRCICDCGKEVFINEDSLKKNTKSCGCLSKDKLREKMRSGKNSRDFSWKNLIGRYKKGAKDRELEFELTNRDTKVLLESNCYYCNIAPTTIFNVYMTKTGKYLTKPVDKEARRWALSGYIVYNGIDRLINSIGYIVDNCVPCCSICNTAKGSMDVDIFYRWIITIAKYRRGRIMSAPSILDVPRSKIP